MVKTRQQNFNADDIPGIVRIGTFEDEEYGILPLYAFKPTPGKPDINTLEGWNSHCAEIAERKKQNEKYD
ncbi:MAG: hypothetical protein GX222_00320 [Ruminococcaceae bacterium]|nr:hypothetical protein [Oscillospiraceae bacterium]